MNIVVRKTGSCVVPYLTHHRDTDIVVIFFDEKEFDLVTSTIDYIKYLHQQGLDGHFLLASTVNSYARIWTYLFHFIEPVEGIIYPDIYQLHSQILEKINIWVSNRHRIKQAKHVYHIYTTLAMWCNGNYELTSDDIARINRFHDRCATDEDFDILFKMLEKENGKK